MSLGAWLRRRVWRDREGAVPAAPSPADTDRLIRALDADKTALRRALRGEPANPLDSLFPPGRQAARKERER